MHWNWKQGEQTPCCWYFNQLWNFPVFDKGLLRSLRDLDLMEKHFISTKRASKQWNKGPTMQFTNVSFAEKLSQNLANSRKCESITW